MQLCVRRTRGTSRQRAYGGLSISGLSQLSFGHSLGRRLVQSCAAPSQFQCSGLANLRRTSNTVLFCCVPVVSRRPPACHPVPNNQSIGNRAWHGEARRMARRLRLAETQEVPDITDIGKSRRDCRIGKNGPQPKVPVSDVATQTPQNTQNYANAAVVAPSKQTRLWMSSFSTDVHDKKKR